MKTKKIFLLAMGLAISLALTACGGETEEEQTQQQPEEQEIVEQSETGLSSLEDVFEDLKRDLENERIAGHFDNYLDTFEKESDIVRHEEGEVLLSVNDVELTREKFEKEMEEAKQMVRQQFAMQGQEFDENSEEFKNYVTMIEEDVKNNFIYEELKKQVFAQGDYDASDDEINEQIEAFKNQFDSEEDFEEFLAAQQVSDELLREIFGEQIKQKKLVEGEGLDYEVSDQEVEEAYEQILQQQASQQP